MIKYTTGRLEKINHQGRQKTISTHVLQEEYLYVQLIYYRIRHNWHIYFAPLAENLYEEKQPFSTEIQRVALDHAKKCGP